MPEYRSLDPKAWAPLVERALWQVAYRQLGMVSLHVPIDVAAKAINILCKEKGLGDWKWLLTGRALVWENVPIDHAIKIWVYVFGSKVRKQNTVFVRQGFWRMYFLESSLITFNKSIVGKIFSLIGG